MAETPFFSMGAQSKKEPPMAILGRRIELPSKTGITINSIAHLAAGPVFVHRQERLKTWN